jgi:membrane protein DedA with SNARE-associated domain
LAAGMMRMPTARFYAANILSAAVWAPALVFSGALLGRSLSADENVSTKIFYVALIAAAGTALAYWVRRQFLVR